MLNFTIGTMKETVEALEASGLRDNMMVIVGGNHITQEAFEYIGADFYTNDASVGTNKCMEWLRGKNKRGVS